MRRHTVATMPNYLQIVSLLSSFTTGCHLSICTMLCVLLHLLPPLLREGQQPLKTPSPMRYQPLGDITAIKLALLPFFLPPHFRPHLGLVPGRFVP